LVRDLRKYARATNIRLAIGFFLLLVVVGDGLIYWVYGPGAAVSGLMCILAGTAPLLLIALGLILMERIVKRVEDE
jgi:hypothetical protein